MTRSIFAIAVWIMMMATQAFASQKGPKGGHHAKPPAVSKSVVKSHARAGTKPAAGARAKTSVKAPKAHTTKTTKTTTTHAKSTKGTKAKSTTTSTTTTTTTSATPTTTLSPVQQKLERNTRLAEKLQGRLPAGTDLTTAAAGFRNLGQFVAAVNVSNNLNLSFSELKTRMVAENMSLGQAIQDLRPSADTQTVVRRAEAEAETTIRATETTTVTSTTTTKSKTKTNRKAKVRPSSGAQS